MLANYVYNKYESHIFHSYRGDQHFYNPLIVASMLLENGGRGKQFSCNRKTANFPPR